MTTTTAVTTTTTTTTAATTAKLMLTEARALLEDLGLSMSVGDVPLTMTEEEILRAARGAADPPVRALTLALVFTQAAGRPASREAEKTLREQAATCRRLHAFLTGVTKTPGIIRWAMASSETINRAEQETMARMRHESSLNMMKTSTDRLVGSIFTLTEEMRKIRSEVQASREVASKEHAEIVRVIQSVEAAVDDLDLTATTTTPATTPAATDATTPAATDATTPAATDATTPATTDAATPAATDASTTTTTTATPASTPASTMVRTPPVGMTGKALKRWLKANAAAPAAATATA